MILLTWVYNRNSYYQDRLFISFFSLCCSTGDEDSPHRKVWTSFVLSEEHVKNFTQPSWLGSNAHVSSESHCSVWKWHQAECLHFPSFRAKRFSTNWAGKRTCRSPGARRGRLRKVRHRTWHSSHIPPIVRRSQTQTSQLVWTGKQ